MDDEEISKLCELLVFDKDVPMQMLDTSKEFFEKTVSGMESLIMKAISTEEVQNRTRIEEGQHTRNRDIVREIINTCKNFRKDIQEEFQNKRGDDEDI